MAEKTLLEVPIKKATELPDRKLRILVYGEAGIGKTTLLSTLPRPCLVIDFEAGADIRLRGEEDIYISEVGSREDLKKLFASIEKFPVSFNSIAFDGFSIFVDRLLKDIVEKRKKAGKLKGDNPGFYEWGQLSAQAREIILGLLKTNAHVVFTALAKVKVNEDGEITEIRPDLPKSIRKTLRAIVDLEGYLYADSEGVRKIVFQSKKGITEVKDRSGKLSIEPANFSIILEKVFKKK